MKTLDDSCAIRENEEATTESVWKELLPLGQGALRLFATTTPREKETDGRCAFSQNRRDRRWNPMSTVR